MYKRMLTKYQILTERNACVVEHSGSLMINWGVVKLFMFESSDEALWRVCETSGLLSVTSTKDKTAVWPCWTMAYKPCLQHCHKPNTIPFFFPSLRLSVSVCLFVFFVSSFSLFSVHTEKVTISIKWFDEVRTRKDAYTKWQKSLQRSVVQKRRQKSTMSSCGHVGEIW